MHCTSRDPSLLERHTRSRYLLGSLSYVRISCLFPSSLVEAIHTPIPPSPSPQSTTQLPLGSFAMPLPSQNRNLQSWEVMKLSNPTSIWCFSIPPIPSFIIKLNPILPIKSHHSPISHPSHEAIQTSDSTPQHQPKTTRTQSKSKNNPIITSVK
ncbi:hypothetical protein BDV28DRAFT_132311 [Aspergillus coremiiformis]|uniref:Uncharacterized protein n=1 Tax=Aspergillus coremiiformis TaxID=138285 RepID=A0A5N6Z840_9EURO|nr:hypothetical protein BDV28DRAFT_132311 [Aspergillus coremiiformis]